MDPLSSSRLKVIDILQSKVQIFSPISIAYINYITNLFYYVHFISHSLRFFNIIKRSRRNFFQWFRNHRIYLSLPKRVLRSLVFGLCFHTRPDGREVSETLSLKRNGENRRSGTTVGNHKERNSGVVRLETEIESDS